MHSEIFTVIQAAQYLQVCEKTIRRLISSNKLMASRIGNRSLRIKKADIDVYLTEHANNTMGADINE